jgi:predicted DNA-binding transcriptional regulator AlpA
MTATEITTFPDGRMDARNAAAYLGLSVRTLDNKRSNGTGPKFVKRGRVFYYREDLDEWLKAGRMLSTTEHAPKVRRASAKSRERGAA